MKPVFDSNVDGNARQSVRKPASVFKSCPHCDSPNLIKFEGQALCSYCDWSSIEVFAAVSVAMAGGIS